MRRTVPFTAAAWEAIRFFLLFIIMTVQLNRQLSMELMFFLLWISSVSLVAAAALFFAGSSPDRYSVFVKLAAVLKVLQLFFGIVLILYIQGVIPAVLVAIGNDIGSMQGVSMLASSFPPILAIVGIDLVCVVFLLLYLLRYSSAREVSGEGDRGGRSALGRINDRGLPKTEVIEVEEE